MNTGKKYFIILIFFQSFLTNELIISATNETNPNDKTTYNSTLHQKLLIEAYKLLKHQYFSGSEIPEMYSHLGSCQTGDSWGTGKMTVGAYNEDLQDVVFGYFVGVRDRCALAMTATAHDGLVHLVRS